MNNVYDFMMGDFVYLRDDIRQVVQINDNGVCVVPLDNPEDYYVGQPFEFEGIPLTQNLLLNSGYHLTFAGDGYLHSSDLFKIILSGRNQLYFQLGTEAFHLRYVHQLQHIYNLRGLYHLSDDISLKSINL
jgi:hypothetical protein